MIGKIPDLFTVLIYIVWIALWWESEKYGTLKPPPIDKDFEPLNRRLVDMVKKQS